MALDNNGNAFIKVYRKFLDWEWYSDVNTKVLFIHCLLKANWKPTKVKGIELEPGQFITSLSELAKELGQTIRQVRDSLDHLQMTGELTSKATNRYRIITINNWSEYQGNDKQNDRQTADKTASKRQAEGQANDKQNSPNIYTYTFLEEDKNKKNIYMCAFDEFWSCYPRKVEKAKAYKQYLARLKDGYSEDQLFTACKNYAKACELNHTEQRYIKHGATFLSVNEPFLDYLEMPKEETPEKPKSRSSTFEQPEKSVAYGKIHNYEEREIDYEALERELFSN